MVGIKGCVFSLLLPIILTSTTELQSAVLPRITAVNRRGIALEAAVRPLWSKQISSTEKCFKRRQARVSFQDEEIDVYGCLEPYTSDKEICL